MKKRKGSFLDFLPGLLTIIAVAAVAFAFVDICKLIDYRMEVKGVARGYLLEMESTGYLTSTSSALMLQELTDMGVNNCDISGTTIATVGYGDTIYLNLLCTVEIDTLNMAAGDMLEYFFQGTSYTFPVNMKSTAKH